MNEQMMRGLEELLARQKCYDVLTRYCRALDRGDLELMRTVYWDDAVDVHGVFEGNAQEFSEFIIKEFGNWFECGTHAICNVHMEYHGDVMCTESYLYSYTKVSEGNETIEEVMGPTYLARYAQKRDRISHHVDFIAGRYIDRLERRDGEWRIALRKVVMDWNENWPGCTILDEGINSRLQLRGSMDRNDPVYANTLG